MNAVQLAQLYVGAVVAGAVLSAGALLVGSFGVREGESFTPAGWVCALSGALVPAGVAGLSAVVLWPSEAQRGSVLPAVLAGVCGAALGFALQRLAREAVSRAAPPPEPDDPRGPGRRDDEQVAPGPGAP